MRRVVLGCILAAGCASEQVHVSVARPKVWGDDQVLQTLASRARAVQALGDRTWGGDVQELVQTRVATSSRASLTLDVAREAPTSTAHGASCTCAQCVALLVATTRPLPAPSSHEAIRRRVEDLALLSSYELLYAGDATLLERRSRALLLRFDLAFRGYVDLGDRRRFVLVAFVIEGMERPAPPFRVYLLSPEWSAISSLESLRETDSDELTASLLGTWGGVGLGGSYSTAELTDHRIETRTETPLQFAIPGGRGDPFTFAFAFGPRRRIAERSALSPVRWFGSRYDVSYELDPGPRTCQALVVFESVEPAVPVPLRVRAFCDGELVAEDSIEVSRALRREVGAFDVTCAAAAPPVPTTTVELYPFAPADLLLVTDDDGPAFSSDSTVVIGGVAIPPRDVRLVGRGRLLAHVFNAPALFQLSRQGVREVQGTVLTPDQPNFNFRTVLLPERRP